VNSIEQQDLQMKLRIRSRIIQQQLVVANEIHGFLLEYGVVIPTGMKKLQANVEEALERYGDKISEEGKRLFRELCAETQRLQTQREVLSKELEEHAKRHEVAKRLSTIPGVGPLTALALVASVGSPAQFKNGRQFAAYLGLTPRQHSTGSKPTLGRITKRGDGYIRSLLAQGAHACLIAALRHHKKNPPARVLWMRQIFARRGRPKAIIATANRTARIAWAIMAEQGAVYDPNCARHAA
jgi:transposase